MLAPTEAHSPWLDFFRRVRTLAAQLDALENEEQSTECREPTRT
jgi:hypothetical protein